MSDYIAKDPPGSWKLSAGQKLSIYRRYISGERQKVTAAAFGISQRAVGVIAHQRGAPKRHVRKSSGQ